MDKGVYGDVEGIGKMYKKDGYLCRCVLYRIEGLDNCFRLQSCFHRLATESSFLHSQIQHYSVYRVEYSMCKGM